ncbi:SURF1 family protein [Inquilinus sp. CAU 1745]|uniref:SURF1 family protein n=1 Tax=Inquilinus sp. CAU 1745 TaxID=3140369 RepID=UPI00325ACCDB
MARFRPTFWPTVCVIPMLAILIGLGTWQVQRLHWKQDIIATIDARMEAEPTAMPASFDDPKEWAYRRVFVEGVFDHDHELHLASRVHDGQVGVHVVTPLARTDPAGEGETILVDRGWVPADRRAPETRPDSQPAGEVRVEGVLRVSRGQGWMQPENDARANLWFWLDLPAMADAAGMEAAPQVILEAAPTAPGALPIGGQTRVDIPNNHLEYAFTWYALAATLLGVYLAFHWRRPPHRPSDPRYSDPERRHET